MREMTRSLARIAVALAIGVGVFSVCWGGLTLGGVAAVMHLIASANDRNWRSDGGPPAGDFVVLVRTAEAGSSPVLMTAEDLGRLGTVAGDTIRLLDGGPRIVEVDHDGSLDDGWVDLTGFTHFDSGGHVQVGEHRARPGRAGERDHRLELWGMDGSRWLLRYRSGPGWVRPGSIWFESGSTGSAFGGLGVMMMVSVVSAVPATAFAAFVAAKWLWRSRERAARRVEHLHAAGFYTPSP